MANTVHPYKGYLNTEFRLHTNEVSPQNYSIIRLGDNTIVDNGVVTQNEYVTRKMPSAGNFLVRFENVEIPIKVEDGYKYGGNTHKKSFVFDRCPWAFVVMHDRTYFYNRNTKEEFVESISPDLIEEVNDNVVFLSNKEENGVTLFSCILQHPVLFLETYEYYDDSFIVWNNYDEHRKKNILTIYSLTSLAIVETIQCDAYYIDEQAKVIYINDENNISSLKINHEIIQKTIEISIKKEFITFIAPHHAIYSKQNYNSGGAGEIYIYDLISSNRIGSISFDEGQYLARINNLELININNRKDYLKKIEFVKYQDLSINSNYVEFDIFPTPIDLFYVQTNIKLSLKQHKYRKGENELCFTKEKFFKSIETEKNEKFDDCEKEIHIVYTDRYFCLYNDSESFVYNTYKHLYHRKEKVYSFNQILYLKDKETLRFLSDNGFWDSARSLGEGNFSLNLFNVFGVIKNKDTKECFRVSQNIGKFYSSSDSFLLTDKYKVIKGGVYIKRSNCPDYVSPQAKYGFSLKYSDVLHAKEPYLFTNKGDNWEETKILDSLYDTSEYRNVLLSENGSQILYRTSNNAMMLNVETGEETEFPNESYIKHKHINGIRPLIRIVETSQARLINPIDGQPIDINLFSEFQFVSPDGKLYADTELSKYVEYHNHLTGEILNKDEYVECKKKFWHKLPYTYSIELAKDNDLLDNECERVFSIIEQFVISREETISNYIQKLDSLKKEKNFIAVLYSIKSTRIKEYLRNKLEEYKKCGIKLSNALEMIINNFLDSFIEKKYVAVIRNTQNGEIVEKVYIERDLDYLNYVAFSNNCRFVAIAGKPASGGLMQLYDLEKHKTIFSENQSTAVWSVAFGKNGHLAGYTSNPYTVILNPENNYIESSKVPTKIQNKSFLTFSPDGKYLACSEQGYIPYRNWDGTTNFNWGHQASSIVSIRNSESPESEIIQFDDLSNQGIEDANKARSVASVSFSQNNERIMMTGKNGVVIIRNLSF